MAATGALLVIGLGLAASVVHRVAIDRSDVPDIEAFVRFDAPTTGAIYAGDGPLLIELAYERREIVAYEAIPPIVRDAILAAEDRRFFAHRGVDPAAWPRVLARNLGAAHGAARRALATGECCRLTFRQGGSTITQQLVRGYFLAHLTRRENGSEPLSDGWAIHLMARLIGAPAANKLARKIEEMRLALWLEETLTARTGSRQQAREMIFARYASLIYFGAGRYGVAAAARHYLGVPLETLGESDVAAAALLAGIIKNPRDYAPVGDNTAAARRRRNQILASLARSGRLDLAATRRAQDAPIAVAAAPPPPPHAPAAVASVLDELRDGVAGYGVDDLLHGRVRVHTTIDSRVQRIAAEAVERGLQRYERRHPGRAGAAQAAVVVLRNADAAVLAEIGGRRLYRGRAARYTDYNRATQALRQPGSALKPLVYAAALRAGASLDTLVLDAPIDVPAASAGEFKAIANYDHTFRGPMRLREALAESRNAATVWLAREVGMPRVLDTARLLGVRTELPPYLSTALGASEVSLRELANVYRALASGLAARPYVVARLESPAHAALYERVEPARPIAMPELPLIQEALRGVVRLPNGTAHALASRAFAVSVLGKTGTSSDYRDAVFVGSTYGPDGITVAVWVGRDDSAPLGHGESGGRLALPVFRDIVAAVYRPEILGRAPPLPARIDRNIDSYLAWRAITAADSQFGAPSEPYELGPAVLPISAGRRGATICAEIGGGTICVPRAAAPARWTAAANH